MTVYVVHEIGDKDVSGALAYGDLYYINRRYVYSDELEDDHLPAAFRERIERAVARFAPKDDYLLIAGDHLQILAVAARLSATHGSFRVLRYDREAKGYFMIWIGA